MVRLIPSHVFVKDPHDVWHKEHTIGNAELAARLGSPITFDRRGTVFAMDSFEDSPLKWPVTNYVTGGGTGHSATLSNTNAYSNGGCVKIVAPNVVNDGLFVSRYFGGLALNRIGIEAKIMPLSAVTDSAILHMQIHTGSRALYSAVRLNNTGHGGLSYQSDVNKYLPTHYTTFDDTFTISNGVYYPLKFVVDVENEKYVRCMFCGVEIDMSDYTVPAIDSTYAQFIWVNMLLMAKGVTSNTYYFDDVIITVEEPV